MTTYSIIQKSQLEGALRLDAEYYQPGYLNLISNLKSQKSKTLGEIGRVAYGTTPSGGVFEKSGIPFVRSQNFSNLLIDTSDLAFCSEKFHNQNKKSAIKPDDILFAAVGATIGELAIVQDEIKEGNINQNIAAVRITDKNINSYFVGFFFASTSGQLQIERLITGNAQPYLNSEQIKSFLIPIFDIKRQNEIANYFHEIQEQTKTSKSLYSQAENLLLEELGLRDFEVEDDLSYIVNLSEIKSSHRVDAEYFQPKYEKIFEFIKSPIKKLEEITKFLNHAKQPPYVDDGEIPIITQRHLGNAFLNLEAINEPDTKFTSEAWLKKYPKYQLKSGDILYYSVGAYIGKTNIVFENLKATAASFITIIRPKEEVDPVYLTVVLNSVVGQLQSEKWQSATAQQYIYPKDIKNFKIPILPKPTQQKIADLVQKSHEARKKAKELLEEAKQKVENAIENEINK